MNFFTHFGWFCETSRLFDLSSRSLGHMIFFAGTAQEAGETKRPLGKRFKEHTNLTIPTGVGDHCNATGHSVSLDNTKVLTREPQWTKRKVKEDIYIKRNSPSMNREQGYPSCPRSTTSSCFLSSSRERNHVTKASR